MNKQEQKIADFAKAHSRRVTTDQATGLLLKRYYNPLQYIRPILTRMVLSRYLIQASEDVYELPAEVQEQQTELF